MFKKCLDKNYFKINDIVKYKDGDTIKKATIVSIVFVNRTENAYTMDNGEIVIQSNIISKCGYKYKAGDNIRFLASNGKEVIGKILDIIFIKSIVHNGASDNNKGEYTSRRFYVVESEDGSSFNVNDHDIINIVA